MGIRLYPYTKYEVERSGVGLLNFKTWLLFEDMEDEGVEFFTRLDENGCGMFEIERTRLEAYRDRLLDRKDGGEDYVGVTGTSLHIDDAIAACETLLRECAVDGDGYLHAVVS